MKLEHVKVSITIDDANELLEAMDSNEKLEFVEQIACHDEIIISVLDQVFTGYTEKYMHSGWRAIAWNGSTPLQLFEKAMIEHGADKVTKERIDILEREIKRQEERNNTLTLEIDKIKHPQRYLEQ